MESLKAKLAEYGIDVSLFGTGAAKSLADLLLEIESGETELVEQDGKLIRRVAVLNVDVFTDIGGRHHLLEERQEFSDGRVRRRKLPTSLSEKIKLGEDLVEAVRRALAEELGVRKFSITSPFGESVRVIESPSYPGLATEYRVKPVEVLIDSTEYKPEYSEEQNGLTTFFRWTLVVSND